MAIMSMRSLLGLITGATGDGTGPALQESNADVCCTGNAAGICQRSEEVVTHIPQSSKINRRINQHTFPICLSISLQSFLFNHYKFHLSIHFLYPVVLYRVVWALNLRKQIPFRQIKQPVAK